MITTCSIVLWCIYSWCYNLAMFPWAAWPQNQAAQGNKGQLLLFGPLLHLLPVLQAIIHFPLFFLCSWTMQPDVWPLIVFVSLFPHFLTLFHSKDHTQTPCGLLNTPQLHCTFLRAKILYSCPIIYLGCIILHCLGLKQLECSSGKPNSWDELLVHLDSCTPQNPPSTPHTHMCGPLWTVHNSWSVMTVHWVVMRSAQNKVDNKAEVCTGVIDQLYIHHEIIEHVVIMWN